MKWGGRKCAGQKSKVRVKTMEEKGERKHKGESDSK